ncbi:MAG: hypothetical protein Q9179_006289, partial [Wetmoreana sp. 5 TL-2023]
FAPSSTAKASPAGPKPPSPSITGPNPATFTIPSKAPNGQLPSSLQPIEPKSPSTSNTGLDPTTLASLYEATPGQVLAPIIITGEIPPPLPSQNPLPTTPPTFLSPDDPREDCRQCTIFFNSVSVYYPPAESSNTDCLTDVVTRSSPSIPPDLKP